MEKNIPCTSKAAEAPFRNPKSGWTASAIEALLGHWKDGLSTVEIASRLGRTVRAVECKIYKLRSRGGIPPARRRRKSAWDQDDDGARIVQQARRRCLYCGENFNSSHRGNRICPGCLEDGPFTSAMV